jgi:hypothetical protein
LDVPGAIFIATAGLVILIAVLALVELGILRFESPTGRLRDGLKAGTHAPSWSRADVAGVVWSVPSGTTWQLLLFADHSLAEFESAVTGLKALQRVEPELRVLALCHVDMDFAVPGLRRLGLDVPVIPVSRRFYGRHNVRAMPFAMIVDPNGRVRISGLANDERAVWHLWWLASGRSYSDVLDSEQVPA